VGGEDSSVQDGPGGRGGALGAAVWICGGAGALAGRHVASSCCCGAARQRCGQAPVGLAGGACCNACAHLTQRRPAGCMPVEAQRPARAPQAAAWRCSRRRGAPPPPPPPPHRGVCELLPWLHCRLTPDGWAQRRAVHQPGAAARTGCCRRRRRGVRTAEGCREVEARAHEMQPPAAPAIRVAGRDSSIGPPVHSWRSRGELAHGPLAGATVCGALGHPG